LASTIPNRIGGIDISANKEWAFHNACEKGHLEVAQWLISLRPDKYIINNLNNKLEPIIRNKKDQLWYRIQYLMELSENKKHGLYKLPLDIIWSMTFYV